MSEPVPGTPAGCASRRDLIEHLSLALHDTGIPRMPARVFAALLCHDEDSLTAQELIELLGVSPAAVSGAVNHLMQVGLLVQEPVAGSRRAHYRLPPGGMLGAAVRRSSAGPDLGAIARAGVRTLGADSPGGRRLDELADFVGFLEAEMRAAFERWQARQEPRAGTDPPAGG